MTGGQRLKRVTLYDVALRSGVSYQTVSRVINDHPNVSKVTRQRVLKAIKELDYRPNRAAQSLVTRRSFVLEVVTFGSEFYGPSRMMVCLERSAKALGYSLTFTNLTNASLEDFREALDSITDRLIDGIVIIAPTDQTAPEAVLDLCRGIPTVLVDNELGSTTPSVVIDQRYGGQLVAQHLLRLGHQRICEISGPLNWHGAKARHEGVSETLREAGLETIATREGDWSPACGYRLTRQLLADGAQFTALIAGNDNMALGAMRALRESGLRIPEDVSVVGFDNLPDSPYFEPPLTTVHQDFDALGRQSIDFLAALIQNPELPVHQRVLYPHFVERLSTRPCR
ncbi:MAG: LacI family DNA-binding transcriptional regulator [Chloroflexota bacterium]